MPFLTKGKTNWKFISIILILSVIIGGGILGYLRYFEKEMESFTEFPEIKKSEKVVKDETADWKNYFSKETEISFKYPRDWETPKETKYADGTIVIGFGSRFKGVWIASIDDIRKKYQKKRQGPSAPGACWAKLYENPDLVEKQFAILKNIGETGEINYQIKKEITKDFVLFFNGSGEKFGIESVYLPNLDIWALKLVGWDRTDSSAPHDFYYKIIFTKDSNVIQIGVWGLSFFEKYNNPIDFNKYLHPTEVEIKEFTDAFENNKIKEFDSQLEREFKICELMSKTINLVE